MCSFSELFEIILSSSEKSNSYFFLTYEGSGIGIEDINDPPNWVSHATEFHGVGVLVTSDEATDNLYQQSGFDTRLIELSNRDNFEGWRVRQTALMLSTVYDDNAVVSVLGASIPEAVVKWLIDNDAIYRLSTMGSGVNVG